MKPEFARYSAYKDADSPWMNEIPSHWICGRIKDFVFSDARTKVPAYLSDDDLVEFVPMSNVNDKLGIIQKYNHVPLKEVSTGYSKFTNGDVIFAKITPCMENGNSAVVQGLKHNIGYGSTEFIVFRTRRIIMAEYFHYFLHNDLFLKNAVPFMKGTAGQKRITSLYLQTHCFIVPPTDEQKAIVSYLDTRTAQLDRQIDLLTQKEQKYIVLRKSLINKTLLRGLSENVPLKDSGLKWAGKIPAHWGIERAKALFKRMARGVLETDGIITAFRDGQVTLRENRRTLGFTNAIFEHGYQGIRVGDLVIHAMDGFAGAIGVSDSNGKSSPVYSAYTPIDPMRVYTPYYGLLVREMALCGFVASLGKGIRERSSEFRHKEFAPLELLVPPFEEQKAIADYLAAKTAHIDQIVKTIKAEIEKLEELRKTLINDVVTGKIKVYEA